MKKILRLLLTALLFIAASICIALLAGEPSPDADTATMHRVIIEKAAAFIGIIVIYHTARHLAHHGYLIRPKE